MSMEEYQAYLEGFNLRLLDRHAQAINIGFWAAYYTNGGKKAKSPAKQIAELKGKVGKAAGKKRGTAGDEGMTEEIAKFEALERKRLKTATEGGE